MTALLWDLGSRKLATPAFPRRSFPELVVKLPLILLVMFRPWGCGITEVIAVETDWAKSVLRSIVHSNGGKIRLMRDVISG